MPLIIATGYLFLSTDFVNLNSLQGKITAHAVSIIFSSQLLGPNFLSLLNDPKPASLIFKFLFLTQISRQLTFALVNQFAFVILPMILLDLVLIT